jgi:outer membrane protein OmpA-like peptidoglycan-associated protein
MVSTQSEGLVAEGQRGHRRGIVLGFTMAELMLLLLFCLLLVSAAVLIGKNKLIEEQKAQIETLRATQVGVTTAGDLTSLRDASNELNKLLMLLYPGGVPNLSPTKIDALWKELVLAKNSESAIADAGLAMAPDVIAGLARLSKALADAGIDPSEIDSAQVASIASELSGNSTGHNWPPIISLDDDGNRFEVGSAEIKPAFRQSLQNDVASKVLALLQEYDVDVIEIIGHTDEQVITPTRGSNLDTSAIAALNGHVSPDQLIPVDNAGLGLARAIAVADVLKSTGKFGQAKFVPLSAAQLMLPGDKLSDGSDAGNDRARRRIEIRVRRTTANLTN